MKTGRHAQRLRLLVAALAVLGLVGCNDFGREKPKNLIDDDFMIKLSVVPNYDTNASLDDKYRAVINYVRSLNLTCDDDQHLSGPVGVDVHWNDQLEAAAQEHSADMAKHDLHGHEGSGTEDDITGRNASPPKKSTPRERSEYHGFDSMTVAENVAYAWKRNKPLPDNTWVEKIENWMKSKQGSCSIIMNSALTEFGMSESRAYDTETNTYKAYWTQIFGE